MEPVPPSRLWYAMSAAVLLAGLAAFAAFLFIRLSGLSEGFQRVVVPGEAEIELAEPGEYVIHHEHKSVVGGRVYSTGKGQGLEGMKIEVFALPAGSPVAVRESTMSATYSFGAYEGTSLMEFDVAAPGRFRVNAAREDGAETPKAVLSISQESVSDIVVAVFGGIGILFGSILLSAVIFIVILLKRSKALKPAAANQGFNR